MLHYFGKCPFDEYISSSTRFINKFVFGILLILSTYLLNILLLILLNELNTETTKEKNLRRYLNSVKHHIDRQFCRTHDFTTTGQECYINTKWVSNY